jgi:hypothetical protein
MPYPSAFQISKGKETPDGNYDLAVADSYPLFI